MRYCTTRLFWPAVITAALFEPIASTNARSGLSAPAQLRQTPSTAPSECPQTLPRRSAPISQAPSNEAPPHSLVLGGVRVTPIYVDSGPFAAAEEHAYWARSGPRYVVVTIRSHVIATYELASTVVKLQTDAGSAYNPLGPSGQEQAAALPRGEGVSEMVFRTGRNGNPARLLVQNPNPGDTMCGPGCFPERRLIGDFALYQVSPSPNCPDGCEPAWRKLGSNQVALSLAALPSLHDIGETPQDSAPVRLGQLEVRITSVGLASGNWDGVRFLTEHDHHEAVVSLATRNVSRHPASDCTSPNGTNFRLYDSRGFEYSAGIGSKPMGVTSLLPGEGTGGTVEFQAWDGAAPRALVITRSVDGERQCAQEQHRPVDMHGGSEVRIPITGVPAVGAKSRKRCR